MEERRKARCHITATVKGTKYHSKIPAALHGPEHAERHQSLSHQSVSAQAREVIRKFIDETNHLKWKFPTPTELAQCQRKTSQREPARAQVSREISQRTHSRSGSRAMGCGKEELFVREEVLSFSNHIIEQMSFSREGEDSLH